MSGPGERDPRRLLESRNTCAPLLRQYLARTAAAGAPDVRAGAGPAWRLPGAARRAVAMGGLAAVFLGTWLVVRGPAGAPPAMQTAAAGAARSAGGASGSEGTSGSAGGAGGAG